MVTILSLLLSSVRQLMLQFTFFALVAFLQQVVGDILDFLVVVGCIITSGTHFKAAQTIIQKELPASYKLNQKTG